MTTGDRGCGDYVSTALITAPYLMIHSRELVVAGRKLISIPSWKFNEYRHHWKGTYLKICSGALFDVDASVIT